MKINAINNRGKRKDFIDLYFLLDSFSFNDILHHYAHKYKNEEIMIPLRSCIYFDDADSEQDEIIMIKGIRWETIKERIKDEHSKLIHSMRL